MHAETGARAARKWHDVPGEFVVEGHAATTACFSLVAPAIGTRDRDEPALRPPRRGVRKHSLIIVQVEAAHADGRAGRDRPVVVVQGVVRGDALETVGHAVGAAEGLGQDGVEVGELFEGGEVFGRVGRGDGDGGEFVAELGQDGGVGEEVVGDDFEGVGGC